MATKRQVERIVPARLALSLCENDGARAVYNNFSEPLFTEAIYGGRARSIKNSDDPARASRVFAYRPRDL